MRIQNDSYFLFHIPGLLFGTSNTDVLPYGNWIQLYFTIKNYYWCPISSTLHKLDTSLRWTVGASPNGVPLRENWLYELRNTQATHTCRKPTMNSEEV